MKKQPKHWTHCARAVARSQGVNESEGEMIVHARRDEVPDHIYDDEEIDCGFCGETDAEQCPHCGE